MIRRLICSKSTFSPQFVINARVISERNPWVVEKDRKRAGRAHKSAKSKVCSQNEFEKQSRAIANSLLAYNKKFGSASAQNGEPPALHPDPMLQYHLELARCQERYAKELLAADVKAKEESMAKNVEHAEDKSFGGQNLASHDHEKEKAIAMINMACWKEIKGVKFQESQKAQSSHRVNVLAQLYHNAEHFVKPENLDAQIDSCLRTVTEHVNLASEDLKLLAMENLQRKREIKLFDAFNDTLGGKQSTESLVEHRKRLQLA